ncbi:MAG: hypothetical protein ABW022_27775 [Actinoplanes sp.]
MKDRRFIKLVVIGLAGFVALVAQASSAAASTAPAVAQQGADTDVGPAPTTSRPRLAGPIVLCPVDELSIPENAGSGVVTQWLNYGETITVEPFGDRIWAGRWFIGENGPDGLANTSAPQSYPLPGASEYSLIARIGNNPYQYVGTQVRRFTNTMPGYVQRVRFRVNDDAPGNGTGMFRVFLRYPCTSN